MSFALWSVTILSSCLVFALSGCQSTGQSKQAKKLGPACELLEPITDSNTAAYARIRCEGTPPIEARCDFTHDPAEFGGPGYIEPTELHWMKHGPNEGVDYTSTRGSGYIVCQKD